MNNFDHMNLFMNLNQENIDELINSKRKKLVHNQIKSLRVDGAYISPAIQLP